MAERNRRTGGNRTGRQGAGRRTGRKKSGGHGLLFSLLFFLAAAAAAYFMSGTPESRPEGRESGASVIEEAAERMMGGRTAEEAPVQEEKAKAPASGKREDASSGRNALPEKQAAAPTKAAGRQPQVSGKIAVVIDDAGRDLASQRVYEAMGIPLTLAVMPNQPHTGEAAASWAAAGLPVIIHQPMESVSGSGMEPIVLLTSMSESEMRKLLQDSFRQIPQAVGMNNHQGSKATTDRKTMDVTMEELGKRGMFFLDSATNTTTAADSAAAARGVRYARNELFVDNSSDIGEIQAMIRKGARMAAGGSVILIGHCRPHTAEAFRQLVPALQAEGIQFIYVSELLH